LTFIIATSIKLNADRLLERNYEEAVVMYTTVVHMTQHLINNIDGEANKIATLLSATGNRAMCYLMTKKYGLCVADCEFILKFFEGTMDKQLPEPLKNKKYTLTLKAYTRRGSALCSMGDYRRAYNDYENASRLAPNDENILSDMSQISEKLNSQVEAEWLKNRGNDFFKRGDYNSAIHCYTLATQQDKYNPVHYSNRAMCYLKLNQYIPCIQDCDTALSILPEDKLNEYKDYLEHPEVYKQKDEEKKSDTDYIPTNEQLTDQLQLKLFLRRSNAYELCEDWKNAYDDMKRVHQLHPSNITYKNKLKELHDKISPATTTSTAPIDEKPAIPDNSE
jgi:tetratricopeptide (TPR) repeat protein